ncbi:MAG: inner-membrane translocator [Chloroflexi bacterium]|nr:inner-membrane translocator [Chloroflexota bacterium]OJV97119.1 MAG: inner-membrane translocator [Chloroflexi bacterium 54-19]
MSATNEESQSASKSPTGEEAQPTAAAGVGAAAGGRTFRDLFRGDLGFVPVLVTLAIIIIVFQILSQGDFLTARNISNLSDQIVTVGTVGIAAMLVLLLGEIDLSLAAVSQCCGAIMAVLLVRQGLPASLAILGAVVVGALIGLVNGFFVAILRIPSFIVTLAGSIAYAGLLLLVLQPQTTLQIRDRGILDINATHYQDAIMGYAVPLIGVALYAVALFYNRSRRLRAGLKVGGIGGLIVRIVVLLIAVAGAIAIFQSNQFNGGIPQSFFIWICLIIIFWLILTQTAFGRHVYAVGGNAEASRRAGINVVGLRIAIFTLASSLAAVGGILQVSRGTAADSQINPTLLLNAIAAAVVGGVSLFGGRGSVWAVVLGAIIIGGLENGLNLLGQGQEIREIVEGIVLVAAVTVDALIRRANAVQGR